MRFCAMLHGFDLMSYVRSRGRQSYITGDDPAWSVDIEMDFNWDIDIDCSSSTWCRIELPPVYGRTYNVFTYLVHRITDTACISICSYSQSVKRECPWRVHLENFGTQRCAPCHRGEIERIRSDIDCAWRPERGIWGLCTFSYYALWSESLVFGTWRASDGSRITDGRTECIVSSGIRWGKRCSKEQMGLQSKCTVSNLCPQRAWCGRLL